MYNSLVNMSGLVKVYLSHDSNGFLNKLNANYLSRCNPAYTISSENLTSEAMLNS